MMKTHNLAAVIVAVGGALGASAPLAGCTSTTNVTANDNAPSDAPPPGEVDASAAPTCEGDVQREDITQVPFAGPFAGPTPLVATTADADGVAAVWFDGVQSLVFRRWTLDGSPATGEKVVATKLNLPGGDAALSSVALGRAADGYAVAYGDTVAKTVLRRVVDGRGVAGDARALARSQAPGTVTQQAPRVEGRTDAFHLIWQESISNGNSFGRIMRAQAFDPAGTATTNVLEPPSFSDERTLAADVGDGRVKLLAYRQGSGSIRDMNAVLAQSNAATDPPAWTETVLKLPRPDRGDMNRGSPTILSVAGGTIFVDEASFVDATGETQRRIEIAELDDLGSVKKNWSVDLPKTRASLSNAAAALEGDALYVAWLDATSTGEDPRVHAIMIDRVLGSTKTAEAKLPHMTKAQGYFDSGRTVGGIVIKDGAVRVPYVWETVDASASYRRTRHVGLQSFCFATR